MSGPTTAVLIEDPVAVLMAAAGIRAAQTIQQGYRQSAELASRHETQQARLRDQIQAADQGGIQSLQIQIREAETQLNHLLTLSHRTDGAEQRTAGLPHAPDRSGPADSRDELATYLVALKNYNADIKSILLTAAASHMELDSWDPGFDTDHPEVQWDQPDAAPDHGTSPGAAEELQRTVGVNRLLARIAHLGDTPEPIRELVRQLAKHIPDERRELLISELRREIQFTLEKHQQRQVQEASALILRQTLNDLGYQVDSFSDTLFVDGGVVHFRRHGWGDYRVRLRVNEKTHTLNFNVIRAVRNASNERSVLDHLAEDRWCAEFPALLKAMEARGLSMNVTRRLEAGELPVQRVDIDQLPAMADDDVRHGDAPLKTLESD